MKTIYYLFAVLFLATSCDQITGNYLENPTINPDDTAKVWRNILLEDFTGYTCGNCPAAHEVAKQLTDTYKDRVIVVGIHAGNFAEPNPAHYYDFRTPEGNAYDQLFGNSQAGLPNGLINRQKFSGSYITRHTKWASLVAAAIGQEADAAITMHASYDDATRKITVSGNLRYVKNSSANDYLCVVITEDSIVQYQKDYRKNPQDIPEYNHMHVFRGAITPTWGDKISATAITANSKFDMNYTYVIPNDKDWNPANLNVVAYVYSKDKEYEVIQAKSVPVYRK